MGRGRIVNALSFFVFLKNVFLNKHSCYYRIDNLNLRFAFLKFVISATIAVPFYRITYGYGDVEGSRVIKLCCRKLQ